MFGTTSTLSSKQIFFQMILVKFTSINDFFNVINNKLRISECLKCLKRGITYFLYNQKTSSEGLLCSSKITLYLSDDILRKY